ncbi:hypothetical protein QYE76_058787 [Lolium multiflorum]|uniref:Reverse transcriptase Ty1/copia-type domain-containing protein n=1 Tax=Lolium multiflorum TaxID=4521 RepID=A0AAD8WRX8_LOLMU|nr:hypothetical protein QYE76_058787 [Lolium multiflorum]
MPGAAADGVVVVCTSGLAAWPPICRCKGGGQCKLRQRAATQAMARRLRRDPISAGGVQIYMLVYVNDIGIAGSTTAAVDRLVSSLSDSLPIKDLGVLDYFLGFEASCTSLTQCRYVLHLLHRVNIENCNSASTPLATGEELNCDSG